MDGAMVGAQANMAMGRHKPTALWRTAGQRKCWTLVQNRALELARLCRSLLAWLCDNLSDQSYSSLRL